MLRKALALAVVAGTALVSGSAPAGAATTAEAPVAKSVVTSDAQRTAGSSTAAATTTIGWDITDYSCVGQQIGVQSAQAKNGPDVNKLVSAHQLQRFQNGRWVTVARKSFAKSFPANGVWYYAPSPSTLWSWNLAAFGRGDYRVNVLYTYKWNTMTVAKRTMNTQAATGTFCRFS